MIESITFTYDFAKELVQLDWMEFTRQNGIQGFQVKNNADDFHITVREVESILKIAHQYKLVREISGTARTTFEFKRVERGQFWVYWKNALIEWKHQNKKVQG